MRTIVVTGGNLLARFIIHVHVPNSDEDDADAGVSFEDAANAVEVLTNFLLGLGYTDVRVLPET